MIFALALLGSPQLRGDGGTWRLFAGAIVSALVGVGAALVIPNTLHWHGKNPYLESVRRVAEYEQGSGRGRLVQYERSLLMSVRHPLLGVGPGNWAVAYPAHAARGDPSLNDSEPGMTLNPWPSSDWIAFVSERGFAAVALLALAFFGIVAGGIRQLFAAQNRDEAMIAAALLATTAAAIVAGLFDAVLLLGVPALLVWAALGALWIPVAPRPMRAVVVLLVIALSAVGAARSVAQLMAMDIYSTRSDRASLESGSHIDPGNYRLQLRLARIGGKSRCEHARAAHALFPNAAAASRPCGE